MIDNDCTLPFNTILTFTFIHNHKKVTKLLVDVDYIRHAVETC